MKRKNILLLIISILLLISTVGCVGGTTALDQRTYEINQDVQQRGFNQLATDHNPLTNVSSYRTKMDSKQYPHTKPIQIQQAKFVFDVVDEHGQIRQDVLEGLPGEIRRQLPENLRHIVPDDLQRYLSPEDIERFFGQQPGAPGQPGTPQPAQPERPQPEAPAEAERPQPEADAPVQPERPAQEEQEQPREEAEQQVEGISEIERRVIELTNVERRNNGLSDLQADASLSNVARAKSNDMQANNYFSHTSPTYGSPFDMIRDFGVDYNAAAENIAMGQTTPEQVVREWMNSPGHRANILNGNYTHIGVGYQQNGHYWTQMFISR